MWSLDGQFVKTWQTEAVKTLKSLGVGVDFETDRTVQLFLEYS